MKIRSLTVALLLGLIACDGATAPQSVTNPSLLITNSLAHHWVYVVWKGADGQVLFADSVGPRVSRRCVRLQPVATDSAQWTLSASEWSEGSTLTSAVTSYWYHPGDLRAIGVLVSSALPRQSPNIVVWDSVMVMNAFAAPVSGQTLEVPPHC